MIPDAPTWAINLAGWFVIGELAYLFLKGLVKVVAPWALRGVDGVTP